MKILASLCFILSAVLLPQTALASGTTHKIAIHVDQNDPQVMNMALNNAKNIDTFYRSKGEEIEIELVAYGPGLMMLREDKSPVKDRISTMALEMPNLAFSGCGNTQRAMSRKEGKEVKLLSEAHLVPSGVVRLLELQESGYSYVRP